ncbi:MAG TPA: SDR family oxidoreductase [Conexibacter sp.]|nr:SDR family oxidoreductase [Conexibacter sp.]
MDLGLQGKRCLVTGASKGIGRATAELLAAEGARLLLVGRDGAALAEAAPQDAEVFPADVTAPDAAARIVAACVERLGGIDVLVNNAGTSFVKPLDELTEADWEDQWQLNVRGPERLMRAAAPRMAQQGGGRIVNVVSTSGKRPSLRNVAYSVTKAAQLSLSRAYAEAWVPRGVIVNAVAPGLTASELWKGSGGLADQTVAAGGAEDRGAALAAAAARVPLGRFAEPDEIAAVIAFLCSERASDVVGVAWSVDGGAVPVIL